jgi:hypothetical protein
MASNAKTIAELLNGDVTVTATDIANDAVTTAKIADDAVTSAKLDTNISVAGTLDVAGKTTVSSTYASDTTEQVRFEDNTGGKLDFFGYANGGKGIQSYADDGSTFYNLNLNPLGGNTAIGESTPQQKLTISSTTQFAYNNTDDTAHLGLLLPSGGTAGKDATGPAVVFGKINSTQPMSGISTIQNRNDYPAIGGLGFWTHESSLDNDDLALQLQIWGDGRRTEKMGDLYRKTSLNDSSAFSNPDIVMFRIEGTSVNYSQYCFKAEIFGNGVSANKAQYISILGSGDFASTADGANPNAPTKVDITRDDIGGGVDGSYPTVTVSGKDVRITPDRQTNYDNYRVIVTVWGRAFRFLDASGNPSDIHDLNYSV